ncbi:uncharacterized membrane protein YcaP (DUF421 family) [Hoeflea marina]|uniref:Uncharacterized membrane protein YcaP (DUF421 family) n=1 Tax=Hoeflea marina TaxID=274592 RepID=A0A317PMY0_9HYPH|nr:YetF domain-containing protein [Hoeflea marina]PWV99840.1 uncharacterized membrane protein YcaP (DUF421 family) [Hoeflea marina]
MDEAVIPFDWVRMLVGDQDLWFMAEIVFRTIFIYIYTYALIRWIGGRSIAQLSLVEFLLVVALGSAVGDSLFYPDVPLLHAMLVITIIVFINKALDLLMLKSDTAQRVIDGVPIWVVHDGRLRIGTFTERGIGKSELFSLLRLKGIANLGEVREAYLEPNGQLSLFPAPKPMPGLPIVPPHGLSAPVLARPDAEGALGGRLCCMSCGGLRTGAEMSCRYCGADDWTQAVLPEDHG